jgi:hypothetical protein
MRDSIAMWRGEVNVDPFAGTHKLFSSPEMHALAPSTGSCLYDCTRLTLELCPC